MTLILHEGASPFCSIRSFCCSTPTRNFTATELADEVCGGRARAGLERGMSASRAGIPAVIAPGCVDMANFGALDSLAERYRGGNLFQWTPTVTLLRTSVEENERIGAIIAAAASASAAPVTILPPLGGGSMLDIEGGVFWDPEADSACNEAIKHKLKPGIDGPELRHHINDPPFAERAAEVLGGMLGQ